MEGYRNNYYDCEPATSDCISLDEVSPFIPPCSNFNHEYETRTNFMPGFSRNMYSYHPIKHVEYHPYNNKSFSKEGTLFRRSCSSYDCNLPLKTKPVGPKKYWNINTAPPNYPAPYRSKMKYPYSLSNKYDFQMPCYSNEACHPNLHIQNVLPRDLEYTLARDSQSFRDSSFNWENTNIQLSNDQSCYQNMDDRHLQYHDFWHLPDNCNKFRNIPSQEETVPSITYPTQCTPLTESDLSDTYSYNHAHDISTTLPIIDTTVTPSSITLPITGDTNSALDSIHVQNTAGQEILTDYQSALNSQDETALSVYFLNNLYPNNHAEDAFHELNFASEPNSSEDWEKIYKENLISFESDGTNETQNYWMFKNVVENGSKESKNTINKNLADNFDINTSNKNKDSVLTGWTDKSDVDKNRKNLDSSSSENCLENEHHDDNISIYTRSLKTHEKIDTLKDSDNIKNSDSNTTTKMSDFLCKSHFDEACKKGANRVVPYLSSDNRCINCFESKKKSDDASHISTKTLDGTEYSEKRKLASKENNILNKELNKNSADKNFIFHAPVININQNQISLPSRNLIDSKNLNAFRSKLCQYFINDNLKLLRLLQNISQVKNTICNNSEINCAEQDSLPLKKENYVLPSSRNIENTGLDLDDTDQKEKNLFHSVIKNLETLLNSMKTTTILGSNDALKEPTHEKYSNTTFLSDNFKCLSVDALNPEKKKEIEKTINLNKKINFDSNLTTENTDSCFVYSNNLTSEFPSNHIETSLSSVTNYVLQEPNNVNCSEGMYESNSFGSPKVNANSKKLKCGQKKQMRKKRKFLRDKTYSPSSLIDPYLISGNTIKPSVTLPDKIFESSSDYSSDSETTLNAELIYSETKKKSNKNMSSRNVKRLSKLKSFNDVSDLFSDELKPIAYCSAKEINQNFEKIYCNAYSQTLDTKVCIISDYTDAQTQWNISDTNFQKTFIKCEAEDEKGLNSTHNEILPIQQSVHLSKMTCNQKSNFVSKKSDKIKFEDKYSCKLRSRKPLACVKDKCFDIDCTEIQRKNQKCVVSKLKKISKVKSSVHRFRNSVNRNTLIDSENRLFKDDLQTPSKNKISRKLRKTEQRCKKIINNFHCHNQEKLETLKIEQSLEDMKINRRISSPVKLSKRIIKASKSKIKNKKINLRKRKKA